jgi:hypothetical protein
MHIIDARNVNDALAQGLLYLYNSGVDEGSRNGPVLVAPGPVVTVYRQPTERVLFSPKRDANPFFHLMEALWIMAGRNDLAWPMYFNKNFAQFSDDGQTVRSSAYGYRWQHWFGWDQLAEIAKELRNNPESRRCVLTMWDASDTIDDFHAAIDGSKDVPCNTHAYLDCRGGRLNLTVCNRSNDIWWGCYGANAVHFSVLQEILAFTIGVPVGEYRQFSNNYHLYTSVVPQDSISEVAKDCTYNNHRYINDRTFTPYPLVQLSADRWYSNLLSFMAHPLSRVEYEEPFFTHVAVPMYSAWHDRKNKLGDGLEFVNQIIAHDWREACKGWITRRKVNG